WGDGRQICIFLIHCSMQNVCHCCDWIRHHYGHLNAEFLSLPVFFPKSLQKHRFLNETIYQITKLFDGNIVELFYHYLSTYTLFYHNIKGGTRDKKNLDDFLNILERQFENLNFCVSPAKKPERRLKHYFKKLIFFFVSSNYSPQSWELIRKETKRHLQRLDMIIGQFRTVLRG
uniref:Uncharacterized protein n=1 Tax=Oncorhynchus kisutch TaxID=8019 RepID=A0A8C7FQJ7_ONCKI